MDIEPELVVTMTFGDYLESTKQAIGVFRWIFHEVVTPESKTWLWRMIGGVAILIVMQALQPGAISYIFNGLVASNGQMVSWGLGVFFVCLLGQKIAQRYHDRAREWVMGLHWARLDDRLTELFLGKSMAQHVHQASLLAPTNIDKGKWKVLDIQRMLFFDALPTVLQLALSFIGLCFLNLLAGLIMAVVVAIYILSSLYLNSIVTRVCTPLDRKFRQLNRRRFERCERVERVKVASKELHETSEMSVIFRDILREDRAFWLMFIDITFIRSAFNAVGLVVIMSWGAWLVWSGQLNLGLLYPLYTWATRVSENIWKLGDIEHQINWNLPAVKSMIAAVTLEPTVCDVENPHTIDSTVPHQVEFRDLSHTYPNETKGSAKQLTAVSGVSFTIEPGKKVALLGPSGSGKTTIMKMLLRFDDPTVGGVFVDGCDLREISQESWKQGIGYIPQTAQVFDGSIRYNLTYSLSPEERQATTDEELWQLMKLLQIDFGERLTEGLETVVGTNGVKLSGGQAQRLMIGSAVVKKPWLLVVDEATSSLDSTTEKQVQEGLATVLAGNQTSALIVAHRLSTVRYLCDQFVMLKPVSDVSAGEPQIEAVADSFEELYASSPTFRRLVDDQGIVI